nr:MAG TPA: hypothetical protein [Caudoviricetes sp.]
MANSEDNLIPLDQAPELIISGAFSFKRGRRHIPFIY